MTEFLFFLKKAISYFLMPLSIVVVLLVVAIYFYHKNKVISYRSLLIATLLLIITALPPISDPLMESLENNYTAYQKGNETIDFIVVLGCYHYSDDRLPATMQLKTCSLERLVEAIRIANLHPEAKLIMSGGSGHNPESNAEKMKQAAMLLGINEARILTENFPKDTREESKLIAPRVMGSRVILITNADHMSRSIKYFNFEGIDAIAAPASYWVKGNVKHNKFDWRYIMPQTNALQQTTVFWYEALGLTAQWFTQLFDEPITEEANQD